MSLFHIFDDKLAMNKIQQKEKMFAELFKPKEEQNIKMEIFKEFLQK